SVFVARRERRYESSLTAAEPGPLGSIGHAQLDTAADAAVFGDGVLELAIELEVADVVCIACRQRVAVGVLIPHRFKQSRHDEADLGILAQTVRPDQIEK